jgi:hypothetical protein
MVMTEDIRHRLHNRLDELMGPEEATALMEAFPPTGWADVATRSDLDQLATVLRQDIRSSAAELRTEMSDLRGQLRSEMGNLRDEVRTDIGNLRDEVRTHNGDLRDEVRTGSASANADRIAIEGRLRNEIAGVRSELLRDQRNLVFSFIGANVAIATLAVTVQQLLG